MSWNPKLPWWVCPICLTMVVGVQQRHLDHAKKNHTNCANSYKRYDLSDEAVIDKTTKTHPTWFEA